MSCECGLPLPYDECCGRFHAGAPAPSAEALMRSRYTAFARGLPAYLLATWHPSTRPSALDHLGSWTRLEVLATTGGGLLDTEGTVEFRAFHSEGVLHECSRFVREIGGWLYVGPLPIT